MDTMAALTVTIDTLTDAEYRQGCAVVQSRLTRSWIRHLRSILSVLLGAAVGFSLIVGTSIIVFPVVLFAALVVLSVANAHLVRRSLLASYLRNFPLEITISSDGVRSVGQSSENFYRWMWFDGWRDCSNVVVAYSQGVGMFFFPKRVLGENADVLRTYLSKKIDSRAT